MEMELGLPIIQGNNGRVSTIPGYNIGDYYFSTGETGVFIQSQDHSGRNLKWNCLDCALIFSSEMQAHEHFVGKKHKNVLKKKGLYYGVCEPRNILTNVHEQLCSLGDGILLRSLSDYHSSSQDPCNSYLKYQCTNVQQVTSPLVSDEKDNPSETVVKCEKQNVSVSDLSIYRTPSGKFYCQPCDLTLNSQAQFVQHSESRKHKHKSSRAFKIKM